LACAETPGVPATVPPGVAERFRGRAGATKVGPGRFEAAAMTAARRFATASCRAADHFVASLDAMNCRAVDHLVASLDAANCRAADHFVASLDSGSNHDPFRASRRASTLAGRCVAERHRFEEGQVVASPAAVSCL
jgi:hypothetical protein